MKIEEGLKPVEEFWTPCAGRYRQAQDDKYGWSHGNVAAYASEDLKPQKNIAEWTDQDQEPSR